MLGIGRAGSGLTLLRSSGVGWSMGTWAGKRVRVRPRSGGRGTGRGMPIYSANLGSGQQYTGADAATGLFDPGQTGAQNIQVRLNSIRFHTTSAVAFSYFAVDPEDPTNKVELFGSTGVDLSDDTGRLLAVAPNGASWCFVFESGVLGADAFLTVDLDFQSTEG